MRCVRSYSVGGWLIWAVVGCATSGSGSGSPLEPARTEDVVAAPVWGGIDGGMPRVLVFSKTAEYRHTSIEPATQLLLDLAKQRGWSLHATEQAAEFTEERLAGFDVVVFLSTTGDVLDAQQQLAFTHFIQAGNGFVGVHAASDTEYDWPWYGELVGAYFKAHPKVQDAVLRIEGPAHPATLGLSATWQRTDEWYGFQSNPRAGVQVLLTLDENSYEPGEGGMGGDHPVAWYHAYDGGRAFYTALGHTAESYQEPLFIAHLAGAIEWAAAD